MNYSLIRRNTVILLLLRIYLIVSIILIASISSIILRLLIHIAIGHVSSIVICIGHVTNWLHLIVSNHHGHSLHHASRRAHNNALLIICRESLNEVSVAETLELLIILCLVLRFSQVSEFSELSLVPFCLCDGILLIVVRGKVLEDIIIYQLRPES